VQSKTQEYLVNQGLKGQKSPYRAQFYKFSDALPCHIHLKQLEQNSFHVKQKYLRWYPV
jgi:hypothetical protein